LFEDNSKAIKLNGIEMSYPSLQNVTCND